MQIYIGYIIIIVIGISYAHFAVSKVCSNCLTEHTTSKLVTC